jgi:hypothetical protein
MYDVGLQTDVITNYNNSFEHTEKFSLKMAQ